MGNPIKTCTIELFYKELLQKNHKTIVLVTHSGVIRSILSYLKNTALEDSFDEINISYVEVVVVVNG